MRFHGMVHGIYHVCLYAVRVACSTSISSCSAENMQQLCMYIDICMRIYIYGHTCMCVCVRACVCVCMYTRTRIHIDRHNRQECAICQFALYFGMYLRVSFKIAYFLFISFLIYLPSIPVSTTIAHLHVSEKACKQCFIRQRI